MAVAVLYYFKWASLGFLFSSFNTLKRKQMFKFLLITGSEMQFSDCYQKDTILLKRAEKFIKQNNLLEISWDASTLNDSQICILQ